ncbi:hypothetical protein A0256_20465 [Mucilaginibacter sp. PAMC 26640]|nr:hypothetical protein A0256_20465 [Mucilaginibacter sp. PAMC 26640]
MERFDIKIKQGKKEYDFEIREYMHHNGDKCKLEVYDQDELVASFNPDPHENFTVCKNPGNLDNTLLHLIADKLDHLS